MDSSNKQKLVEVYQRYGFKLAEDQSRENIIVFTLKSGYFDNAEIVKLDPNANHEKTFDDFTKSGYACKTIIATSPEQAENELFEGFFSVNFTRQRLVEDYDRFTKKIVAPYEGGAQYSYIKAPYQINGSEGFSSPPQEVIDLINNDEPILFLIEAAAGFGKTCTALEIVNLLAVDKGHLPLYAELSRNRQARIFRYILLDEIDRTFPLLSSKLVQTEIQNGRIITILDGFDELLRKKNEDTNSLENTEPMLETVSELLTGKAKIIITTRRTVLFDGDDFHQWLENHAEKFQIIRIKIQEPKISDWLPDSRLSRIENSGLKLDALANPVLLSYLRCIDETTFSEVVSSPENIVESYFSYMLDRERERQDLRMNIASQHFILQSIAEDMITFGYTAESRDYIINCILTNQQKLLDETRAQYPMAEKPSREEIANKLASHALFDRSAIEPNKIGFINEFVFGHYIAEYIITQKDWLNDDLRFIEPAVRSYQPRSEVSRATLYAKLNGSIEYLDTSSKIEITTTLIEKIPFPLINEEAEGLTLNDIILGNFEIKDFQFNDCQFKKCTFDLSNIKRVTFLNCKFYEIEVINKNKADSIFILGGNNDLEIQELFGRSESEYITEPVDHNLNIDRFILKKFWPTGESCSQMPSRPIYRPMKKLTYSTLNFTSRDIYEHIQEMKKDGILLMNKTGLISLNQDEICNIQKILMVNAHE
jgi:hypothetical protein